MFRSTTRGAILATVPFTAFPLFAPQWLVAAFSPTAELLGQSDASLRVIALAMLIAIPAEMWYTAVVGTGDSAAALGIEFVIMLVMLGVTWFAAIHLAWPMALVWMSVPISWLVCLAISFGWVKSGFWKRLEV